jgi:hypothetical protein
MSRLGKCTQRSIRYAVLSLSVTLMPACAQLPEYAKPHRVQIDEISNHSPTGFTYRQLTTDDFRATSLPKNLSTHGERINAQSMIQIRMTPNSSFSITRWPYSDQIGYTGIFTHLAFEAFMIPDKSWWSPKIKPEIAGYVLQHEQIHFALMELAARKLTRDAQQWASNLLVIRETPQEVHSEVFQQIKEMINSAMEANQKRHEEFDKDTSLFYSPSWQAWWLEKVEEELKQTESDKNGR